MPVITPCQGALLAILGTLNWWIVLNMSCFSSFPMGPNHQPVNSVSWRSSYFEHKLQQVLGAFDP